MLWAAIALMLVVLLAIGLAGARSSRRRQSRDGGESGYSPLMVADSGSPAHICDTNAADWSDGAGDCGGGDGGGGGD